MIQVLISFDIVRVFLVTPQDFPCRVLLIAGRASNITNMVAWPATFINGFWYLQILTDKNE